MKITSLEQLANITTEELKRNTNTVYNLMLGHYEKLKFLTNHKYKSITLCALHTIKKVKTGYKLNLPVLAKSHTHTLYISNSYIGDTNAVWDKRVKNLFAEENVEQYKLINSNLNKLPTEEDLTGQLVLKRLADKSQLIPLYIVLQWEIEL